MSTPSELLAAATSASRDVQARIDNHPVLVKELADADRLANLAAATAYLAATGTVAEREAHVTKACIDERYSAQMAKGLLESNKLAIQGGIERMRMLSSLSATVREEMRLARSSDGP